MTERSKRTFSESKTLGSAFFRTPGVRIVGKVQTLA